MPRSTPRPRLSPSWKTGNWWDSEVDLHAEVAKRMGKQLVMTNIPFAGLALGLQAKKWDAAGNTWINKERLVMMDFSDPWVDAQLAFVTRKNDAITSPEQLKGKTVGAEAGTAEQRWLDANQESTARTPSAPTTAPSTSSWIS